MIFLLVVFITGWANTSEISEEISLWQAKQSTYVEGRPAWYATDRNLDTYSCTKKESPAWFRVYFREIAFAVVEKVVIEKGRSNQASCVFTVSVYDGEIRAVCGSYGFARFGQTG